VSMIDPSSGRSSRERGIVATSGPFTALRQEKYLSLVTRRRDGREVATPMWFVVEGERIYMRTGAQSAKVKRIRNNGRVTLAPCTAAGRVTGTAVSAHAVVADASLLEPVNRAVKQKYGVMKTLIDLINRLRGLRDMAVIEISATGEGSPSP